MLKHALWNVYTRIPDISVVGPPVFMVGNFLHGIHRLPVKWSVR